VKTIANLIRDISVWAVAEAEGDPVKKFIPMPKKKPPRRKSLIKNKSNRSDYMKNYMEDYRGDTKKPDNAKELQKEQQKRLREKFNIKGGSF
jgi:hypothetical protein